MTEAPQISRRQQEAFRRVSAGTYRKRTREQQAIRTALQRLAVNPDYLVMLDFFRHLEWEKGATEDLSADTGALLRSAGRRSLLRELERLDERVTDDDRSEQRE